MIFLGGKVVGTIKYIENKDRDMQGYIVCLQKNHSTTCRIKKICHTLAPQQTPKRNSLGVVGSEATSPSVSENNILKKSATQVPCCFGRMNMSS